MARYIGIDLGGTNIKAVVLEADDERPAVVATTRIPTLGGQGHEAVIRRMAALAAELDGAHGPTDGTGLGVPGLFDPDTGVVTLFTNLPGQWIGVPLQDLIDAAVGGHVTLVNDARAFTLAEGLAGAGRGYSPVVCLTLGTGIGGGIMIDGRIHWGATGVAGEIAHQTVLPEGGRMCGCGNRGCAEAMARADVLADMAGRSTAAEVFAGVAAGDEACLSAVDSAANYLGIALANVVTVVGPERLVIGGGVAEAGELFLGPIRVATLRRVTLVPHDRIDIVPAELGSEAGAVGAALAAQQGL